MPTDAPTAFFSYCRADSDFALKLAEDLKAAGARVWIDQLDIEPGTPWDRAVEEALASAPCMLVILSPVSVASDNVRDEVSYALSKQKRVIPVLYRDCDVPFRLARLQHIDFRNNYDRGLKALVRALGAEHSPLRSATPPSHPSPLDPHVAPAPEARLIQEVIAERTESQSVAGEKWARFAESERQPLAEQQTRLDPEFAQPAAEAHATHKPPQSAVPLETPSGQTPSGWRAWFKKRWKWILVFPGAAVMAVSVFVILGSSEVAKLAFARAESNPAVMQRLGQPLKRGWITSGNIDESGTSGSADMGIPISGPKGKGTLYLRANKSAGTWNFDSLQVQMQGESTRIDLLNSKIADLLREADAGNDEAMARLGYAYRGGDGVAIDYAQAAIWFRKAAEAGNLGAMTALGEMYFDGQGVERDYRQAVAWFRKAADMNDPTGIYYLGKMYEKGDGVEKNLTEATALYRKSAGFGYGDAKRALQRLGAKSQ